jgi:TPR repeat protein
MACDAKIHGACRLLSLIYWNGGHDREPDSAKAEQLMRRACDGDDYYACWTLSTWLVVSPLFFKPSMVN